MFHGQQLSHPVTLECVDLLSVVLKSSEVARVKNGSSNQPFCEINPIVLVPRGILFTKYANNNYNSQLGKKVPTSIFVSPQKVGPEKPCNST